MTCKRDWVEEGSFDQLLFSNSDAFGLINVKSPICPGGWRGGGGGGGGVAVTIDKCMCKSSRIEPSQ